MMWHLKNDIFPSRVMPYGDIDTGGLLPDYAKPNISTNGDLLPKRSAVCNWQQI